MRRLSLVVLSLLAVLPSQRSDAQIIRSGRFGASEPQMWVSAGAGLQQGWTVVDGTSGVRWELSDATQYGAAIERTLSGGTSLGVRATTARVPLDYVPSLLGSAAKEADARVSQAFAVLHVASGRGLHSVLELGAGATFYSAFRERGSGAKLAPEKTDVDFAFVFGYGIGYTFSRAMQVDVVQDLATSVHQKTGLSAGEGSSARIQSTRIVARLGLGG
ncbi:MAG: hypothetical protein ABIP93_20755 [Gemmatimonadaceae bacterium]